MKNSMHEQRPTKEGLVRTMMTFIVRNKMWWEAPMSEILAQDSCPREKKIELVRRLSELEWDFHEASELLKPTALTRDEWLAEHAKMFEGLLAEYEALS